METWYSPGNTISSVDTVVGTDVNIAHGNTGVIKKIKALATNRIKLYFHAIFYLL